MVVITLRNEAVSISVGSGLMIDPLCQFGYRGLP